MSLSGYSSLSNSDIFRQSPLEFASPYKSCFSAISRPEEPLCFQEGSSDFEVTSTQLIEGVKKTLSPEEKEHFEIYAERLAQKINTLFAGEVEKEIRLSKAKISDGKIVNSDHLPFTVWVLKDAKGFNLHFIPNSKDVQVWHGHYKKVKESFFLHIPRYAKKGEIIPVEDSVCYRVQKVHVSQVEKGLSVQKEVLNSYGDTLFAPCPIAHKEKTLTGKLEMRGPRFVQDMKAAVEKGDLGFTDLIDQCLSITEGVRLLGQMNPPVVHMDLKAHNILERQMEEGFDPLIADFDRATYSESGDVQGSMGTSFHRSELTSWGQISPKTDLYSLAVLIAKALLPDFPKVYDLHASSPKVATLMESSFARGLLYFNRWKERVPPETANTVEELLLEKDSIKQLTKYAKTLEGQEAYASVRKFVLKHTFSTYLFPVILKALQEEENVRKQISLGRSAKELAEEFTPPSAEEFQNALMTCKEIVLEQQKFLQGEISDLSFEDPQRSLGEETLSIEQIRPLFEKALPQELFSESLLEDFCHKINLYLKFIGDEGVDIHFKKEEKWGADCLLPFSGAIRKNKEGTTLYIISPERDEISSSQKEFVKKKAFSLFIPEGFATHNHFVKPSLCIQASHFSSIMHLNRYEKLYHQLPEKAKEYIVKLESTPLLYSVEDFEEKAEITHADSYDSWGQDVLASKLSELSVEQKLSVASKLLKAVSCFNEIGYLHGSISSSAVHLQFPSPETIEAKLFLLGSGSRIHGEKNPYRYRSPEDRKDCFSKWADRYAVGMILKELFLPDYLEKEDFPSYQKRRLSQLCLKAEPEMEKQISELLEPADIETSLESLARQLPKLKAILESFAKESSLAASVFDWHQKMQGQAKALEDYLWDHSLKSGAEWQKIADSFEPPSFQEILDKLQR